MTIKPKSKSCGRDKQIGGPLLEQLHRSIRRHQLHRESLKSNSIFVVLAIILIVNIDFYLQSELLVTWQHL